MAFGGEKPSKETHFHGVKLKRGFHRDEKPPATQLVHIQEGSLRKLPSPRTDYNLSVGQPYEQGGQVHYHGVPGPEGDGAHGGNKEDD